MALLGTLLAGAAAAQALPAGTLRIVVAAVSGPGPAPETGPALTGLRVRLAGGPGGEEGPLDLGSRGSRELELPAGSYVAFGARLRRAVCPEAAFEVKSGRRVWLVFETGVPGAAVPVCAVRVSADP